MSFDVSKQQTISYVFTKKKIEICKFKDKLESNEFMLGNLPIKIVLFPFGSAIENYAALYINCYALSLNISYIFAGLVFFVEELNAKDIYKTKMKNGQNTGPGQMFASSKLKNCKQITVKITYNILKIWDDDDNEVPKYLWNKCLTVYDYKSNNIINDNIDGDSKVDGGSISEVKTKLIDLTDEIKILKQLLNDTIVKFENKILGIQEEMKQIKKSNQTTNNDDSNPVLMFLKSIKLEEY